MKIIQGISLLFILTLTKVDSAANYENNLRENAGQVKLIDFGYSCVQTINHAAYNLGLIGITDITIPFDEFTNVTYRICKTLDTLK